MENYMFFYADWNVVAVTNVLKITDTPVASVSKGVRWEIWRSFVVVLKATVTTRLKMLHIYMVLEHQVRNLFVEAGGKVIAKKDLNNQRNTLRDILEFLEDGYAPDTSVKIGRGSLTTLTWSQLSQLVHLLTYQIELWRNTLHGYAITMKMYKYGRKITYLWTLLKLRRNTISGSIPINRGLIQAILTSLPPQPIGEATKASNL
ncbi:interferon-related developmental regulator family protein [Tanacetum coccineum]